MTQADDREGGFTVLDGAALVVAAAVASVHMRAPVRFASGIAWGLVWIAFAGVALTAAGPILYLVRRYGRQSEGYPGTGDRLWAVLGLPWIVCAALRSFPTTSDPRQLGLYGTALSFTIGAVCLGILASLWKLWVLMPTKVRTRPEGRSSWTDRMGMALSVAWPLQCGFLLVVLDSESMPLR